MTIIVVSKKYKSIVGDGRTTGYDKIISDNSIKVCELKKDKEPFIFGFSGDIDVKYKFINSLSKGNSIQDSIDELNDGEWYLLGLIKNDIIICDYKNTKITNIPLDHYAIGCGADFAIAAMDFGKTPKEAVKYAISKDYYCGGKITEIKQR